MKSFLSFLTMIGISVPGFYLGTAFIDLVAVRLGWISVSGNSGFTRYFPVALCREVRIVDEYYSIYHVRFGERVRMEWRISDSLDLTETMVPSFILQRCV